MLSLHGAEGLRLCRTTWHEIKGDTGLSIGGTCAQLGDARLRSISLERPLEDQIALRSRVGVHILSCHGPFSFEWATASASLRVFHTRSLERILAAYTRASIGITRRHTPCAVRSTIIRVWCLQQMIFKWCPARHHRIEKIITACHQGQLTCVFFASTRTFRHEFKSRTLITDQRKCLFSLYVSKLFTSRSKLSLA